uniref:Novel toxin 11 domain-containing protein n=1 Tax=Percolomonas cosmopolitus TaxID=63605 RepID=A0A6U0LFG2_9EUKA|mmetsp:Transcript_8174/g.30241  ORF Transcript_8174/g.30241 Transcript_8174/m.30241 type:complete len:636 (+) Transcript_8174:280-2187(+)|eukprot:CAMPEP_0117435712 /NCGR_PEP_ID=MMETSP0759-20121206/624_1 /TAXON_ID=63605 /ORGANISM="Percolomonas cosmopolitus, Strain WS" /LENGTH=635 /DNA_ID=CAMNT_0005227271 /DNA_START=1116 /DNA_END=3023 /DNA_ORIENTATION=-
MVILNETHIQITISNDASEVVESPKLAHQRMNKTDENQLVKDMEGLKGGVGQMPESSAPSKNDQRNDASAATVTRSQLNSAHQPHESPLSNSVELLHHSSDMSSSLEQERETMELLLRSNNVAVHTPMSLFERYSIIIGESLRQMHNPESVKKVLQTDVWKRQKRELDLMLPQGRDGDTISGPSPTTISASGNPQQKPSPLATNASPNVDGLLPFTMIENYFVATDPLPKSDSHQEWLELETKKLLLEKITNNFKLSCQEVRLLKKMRINIFKENVWQEFRQFGYHAQFKRDSELWYKTLQYCPHDRKGILERIFTVVRYGGLLMRPWDQEKSTAQKWKFWRKTGWPISASLSHGSRIIIQLDRERQPGASTESAALFWNWLISGDAHTDASTCISTAISSQQAHRHGKALFKRLGATHCIDYFPQKMQFKLPANRMKLIHEVKTLGLRDSKVLASRRTSLIAHSHWGFNIPMGGFGREPFVHTFTKDDLPLTPEEEQERIDVTGKYGHVYIYYLAPTTERFGGLLIGVESSEPQVEDTHGEMHTIQAKSPLLSPTAGFKWYKKGDKPDLRDCFGPSKYNGLLIDLSGGWRFLMKKEWNDEFVFETSDRPKPIRRNNQEFIQNNINVPMGFHDFL